MDKTTLKVAIAAFMHDIGKFADKKALDVTEQYINDNAGLYLPFRNGRHSHYHAVYTAAFTEYTKDILPDHFNCSDWGEGDTFVNLAAGHHKPETPMQWIIAEADRISSGWDRETFDKEYSTAIPWKNYKKTRLLPLFEQLMGEPKAFHKPEDFSFRYPLKRISPENIFPKSETEILPKTLKDAETEYSQLFDEFIKGLRLLRHRQTNLELWFEHFESLMMICTSSVPAARAGNVLPDVSLYDHSKATAAIAAAMYAYHHAENSLEETSVRDNKVRKFLIVNGNFQGIQNFIFSGYGDIRKYRSKILRGRSFAVSLLSELAADMLCREIGLPFTSVILNAAGRFTILAPNILKTKDALKKVEKEINNWLFEVSYGETVICFSELEASCYDFVSGNFFNLWEKKGELNDETKFSRIDLDRYGGAIDGYLDKFDGRLAPQLCHICGKRPATRKATGKGYVKNARSSCDLCRDHVFLGTKLVKEESVAVLSPEASISGENRLFKPVFDKYQVIFPGNADPKEAARKDLLKHWDLSFGSGDFRGMTVKFINGYVPKCVNKDREDPWVQASAKRDDILQEIEEGAPKILDHIACKARIPEEENGDKEDKKDEFRGIEALGVLKADVDNLGILMACGLKPERLTLSRLATLSRQLNGYFAVWLPHFLMNEPEFSDVYTVFAGGDDLFLIGPWNCMTELALRLRETFADYVCRNKKIHFSAGITLHKAHTSVETMAEAAEHALETSKNDGRNRITLFSETVTWDELEKFTEIKKRLRKWLNEKWISNTVMYRFNKFMQMAEQEKRLKDIKAVRTEDMACMKWHSLLAYTTGRNVKSVNGEERKKTVHIVVAEWLDKYGAKMKIPLWDILYNRRK